MSDILIVRIKKRIQIPENAFSMGKYGYKAHIYPPATLAAIKAAETAMGFRLPDLLRRLYLEVGNGGFGPGYGLIGVEKQVFLHMMLTPSPMSISICTADPPKSYWKCLESHTMKHLCRLSLRTQGRQLMT